MDAKAEFMERMETIIYRLVKRAQDELHRARHFPARSEGQKRRRQRERAERITHIDSTIEHHA